MLPILSWLCCTLQYFPCIYVGHIFTLTTVINSHCVAVDILAFVMCIFYHIIFRPTNFLINLFFYFFRSCCQKSFDDTTLVRTCGKPNIQNIMNNVTVKPGQSASFKCQVDMSCIVAYIEWYHEMDNGTEKLIKVRSYDISNIFLYNTKEQRPDQVR